MPPYLARGAQRRAEVEIGQSFVFEILESPTRAAIVAAMAPVDARGRYQGAVVLMFGAAQLVGPKLGTWTLQHAARRAVDLVLRPRHPPRARPHRHRPVRRRRLSR
jgi:MFS family permease